MTAKLTIIGLGKIGTSFGLALAEQKNQITRVGHDTNPESAQTALKKGAVDKIENNLHNAVDDADIILMALPVDEMRNVLELIAEDLKEGAVVIDTSPVIVGVTEWAKQYLPKERYFVTMSPTLNPAYLHETETGVEAAHADLFKNSLIVITSPVGTDQAAITLAGDLTSLIGGDAFFADPWEFDGLSASTRILPKMMAVALLNATTSQPGWPEARKIAANEFFSVTEPMYHLDEAKQLGLSAIINRENTIRVINDLMYALQDVRDALEDKDEETLTMLMNKAFKARELWLSQRNSGQWDREPQSKIPSAGENMRHFLVGGLFDRKKKKE